MKTDRPRRLRSARRVITVVLLYFVTAPAVASAGYNDIYAGWLNVNGAWGPRHSLSSVWATWYDGYDACMNALNDSDSTWAGSWGYCAHPGDTTVAICTAPVGFAGRMDTRQPTTRGDTGASSGDRLFGSQISPPNRLSCR